MVTILLFGIVYIIADIEHTRATICYYVPQRKSLGAEKFSIRAS